MNSVTLLVLFEEKLGTFKEFAGRKFLTDEIEKFVNEALYNKLREFISRYEIDEEARVALTDLVKGASLNVNVTHLSEKIHTTSKIYDLPADHWATVEAHAGITHTTGGTLTTLVKPVKHDFFKKNIDNPFRKPYENLIWRIDFRGYHELVPDSSTTINSYFIRYVSTPTLMNISSNSTPSLNDEYLYDVIDEAIQLALNSIKLRQQVI